ncbi:MAG TPA: hypothetical protein VGK23_01835 [Methanomassiliicoccales archaeon]|jgi:hypothetical protein
MDDPLVDKVVGIRVGMIRNEISRLFPQANIEVSVLEDGRAAIKMLEEGSVIGLEFVETGSSWNDPKRKREYYVALINKCRLEVIVPVEHAMSARLRMLEYNQMWLFYYQVYSYDGEGNLKKIIRPFEDRSEAGPSSPLSGYA